MSPVPVDPFPDFLVGAVANPDQVDARFLELYKALDPARNGLDWTNVRTGGLWDLVTSLPASPRDGQECHFLADAANGVVWHLRYRAASGSVYKWEFVGGGAMAAEQISNGTVTALGVYSDLATAAAPSVVVPVAGVYEMQFSAEVSGDAANEQVGMSVSYGATAVTADAATAIIPTTGATTSLSKAPIRRTVPAPGTTVKLQGARLSLGTTAGFQRMALAVRPVRVG